MYFHLTYLRTFMQNEILLRVIYTANKSGPDYAQEWW